jgi:predicted anti-sigma-YlaC factor YlaD
MSDKPTIADLLAADPRDSGCAQVFEMLSVFADLELDGEDAAARFPGIAAHLRSCPACRVDHDGILAAARIQRTPGGRA